MYTKKFAQVIPTISPSDESKVVMLLPEIPLDTQPVTVFINGLTDNPTAEIEISGLQITAAIWVAGMEVKVEYWVYEDVNFVTIFEDELARVQEERQSSSSEESEDTPTDSELPTE